MIRHQQHGASLVEALVATVVMGFGMLAVTGIQGKLRYSGDAAKQRAEATRIAHDEMEGLRSYVALSRSADTPAAAAVFDEIGDAKRSIPAPSTTYELNRTVQTLDDGSLRVQLAIDWTDRQRTADGERFDLRWSSVIPRADPRLAAMALTAPENGVAQRRALNRHPAIPPGAKDLDDGRSVYKPSPTGSLALVFDNVSGLVTQRCTGVPAGTPTIDLGVADLLSCTNFTTGRYLMSGHIRFSLGAAPDPAIANDAPIAGVLPQVVLTSSVHPATPECFIDTGAAAPAVAVSEAALAYQCVIAPRAPTADDPNLYWSGRINLSGLNLTAGGQRVCRYSDDYDGSGTITNPEHPLSYSKLSQSLARQNFLVVRNEAECPAGQSIDVDAQIFRSTATAPHQP